MGPENDLMELLWRHGQIVTHNQSQIKHELAPAIHGDEIASWFQGDSVVYGSNISYEISTANIGTDLRLLNEPREERVMNGIWVEVGNSILTQGSNCEGNHVENAAISSHNLNNAGNPGAGGSEFSFGRTDQRNISNQRRHKRKMRNGEEPEHHIEDADESIDAYKSAWRSSSAAAGRSRSAEVHNLSERKRRDRINEKMRALQELVPNCNKVQKSDKTKLLDDVIEYIKSLQLQLQIMSRGSGIAPLMFPGAQNYIPSMGVSMGYAPFHGLVQLRGGVLSSAEGLISPMQMVPSQHIDPVLLKHKQNTYTPELYASGFNHIKPPPQMVLQDHVAVSAASGTCLPTRGEFGSEYNFATGESM